MSTVVKNMVLYTSTFVKSVDFMLRLLTLTTHIHTGIKKQIQTKGVKEMRELLDVSITLIVVMASCVFAYVKTHQIVHIKYVQFFVYKLYLNEAFKKRETVS